MSKCLKSVLIYSSILLLQSCTTNSVLRTARVLDEGQVEISAGIADGDIGHISQVVIVAYGITDRFEIEGRWEDEYISATSRFQLLKSEQAGIDSLVSFEVGYGDHLGWLGGPGIMFGRRFNHFSPYVAYKYRFFEDAWWGYSHFAHVIKLGARYDFTPFWKNSKYPEDAWFLGLEAGPTITHSSTSFEWAANFGVNF